MMLFWFHIWDWFWICWGRFLYDLWWLQSGKEKRERYEIFAASKEVQDCLLFVLPAGCLGYAGHGCSRPSSLWHCTRSFVVGNLVVIRRIVWKDVVPMLIRTIHIYNTAACSSPEEKTEMYQKSIPYKRMKEGRKEGRHISRQTHKAAHVLDVLLF